MASIHLEAGGNGMNGNTYQSMLQQDENGDDSYKQVPKKLCASSWARLIQRIYNVNPLECHKCGSEMRIIAIITNKVEIRKILKHLIKTGKAPPGVEMN